MKGIEVRYILQRLNKIRVMKLMIIIVMMQFCFYLFGVEVVRVKGSRKIVKLLVKRMIFGMLKFLSFC